MRTQRIKPKNTAIYHCMSRTVDGQACLNPREKEILRKMIVQVADFSGAEVLTYCIMNNHFHVLVRIAPVDQLPDAELLRRFRVLYPKATDHEVKTVSDVERILSTNDDQAAALRDQLLARMGDVSQFMKTLKQRFSIWFNKTHDRYGPLWSDRFKSVLVEGQGFALQTMAAYIDLNPVRAGLVADPKDYRFCGYAEAVAGDATAISGLQVVTTDFSRLSAGESMQSYRQLLFGKGSSSKSGSGEISRSDAIRVLEKENGVLPPWSLLHCRIRYFTEGAILGSCEFVRSYLEEWERGSPRKRPAKTREIVHNDQTLSFIKDCRGSVFS